MFSLIGFRSCWLHNTALPKPKAAVQTTLRASSNRQTNVLLGFCSAYRHEDAVNIEAANVKEWRNVNFLLSYAAACDAYVCSWATARSGVHIQLAQDRGQHWSGHDNLERSLLALCEEALPALVRFLLQLPEDECNVLKADGIPHERNQRMARELKLLDILFWTLYYALEHARALKTDSSPDGHASSRSSGRGSGQGSEDAPHGVRSATLRVKQKVGQLVQLLYKSIICCFIGHRRNELYLANHMVNNKGL